MRAGKVMGRIRFFLLFAFSSIGFASYGQTDTEFWFSVPEINRYHVGGNNDCTEHNNGSPVFFRITAGDMESTVSVSMPANASFNGGKAYTVVVPANKTVTLDLNSLKFVGDDWGGVPGATKDGSMENRLRWTQSDLAAAKPYVNRNNKGVHITATTPITVYYEISAPANMDLLTLKGRNALGKEFFIPFQNTYNAPLNRYLCDYRPYSSFDIVATADNTHIRITPTHDVFVFSSAKVKCDANTPFDIWLNKGETAILPPYDSDRNNHSKYRTSNRKEDRLVGSKVEVIDGGDIAIITRDDMVTAPSGNVDFVGDQIVPTRLTGNDYAVVRGQLVSDEEYAYVVATQNSTSITVNGAAVAALDAGQSQAIQIPSSTPITSIHSDKPVYVYHLSGFGSTDAYGRTQTQFAGALIPTISTCTGSTRVAFNRTKPDPYDFYLNILVRDGAESSFKLKDKNGNDVTGILPSLNNPANYKSVGASYPFSGWKYARINAKVLTANEAYMLSNEGDIFHLGLLNGAPNADAFYGYFSDFNELKIDANVAGVKAGETKVCFGEKIQLYAKGGTTYKWTPAEYLSDPTIYNPVADIPVQVVKQYQVEVSGACGMKEVKTINLQILPPVKADFTVDNITGCSPLTVNFKNTSLNAAELRWNFGDGRDTTSKVSSPPGLVEKFSHLYVNNTDSPITYTVQLKVKSAAACGDVVEKKITVYPSVVAKLNRIDPIPISYCSPRRVTFENVSPPTALPASDITYIWDYGDGGSVKTSDPAVTHDFSVLNKDKQRYNVALTMINKFGCKSVAKDTVDVYGKVHAFFALDKTSGCPNPTLNAVLTDGSTGAIAKRTWDWNGFSNTPIAATSNAYDISTSSTSATTTTRTVKLEVEGAGGCKDFYQQTVTIYPYVSAQFSITDTKLCDGEMLNINNNLSAGATDFFWEFGDGVTSKEVQPSHLYSNSTYATVQYDVKLTAKSAEGGCQSSFVLPEKVTVYSRIDPNIVVKDLGGCAPFKATIVNASKGNLANTYEWDFGDKTAAVVETGGVAAREHLFTNMTSELKGYNVNLKITNEGGCTKNASSMALVYPQPVAGFTVDKPVGCNPLRKVHFEASTAVPEYRYTWQFGDKDVGAQPNVDHDFYNVDYTADKTYNVDLTVNSIYGCSASASKPVTVHPALKAAFTVQQQSACSPFDVQVTPSSLGATAYAWDYGDGRTATKTGGDPFTIRYDNTGATSAAYTISLVATSSGGACQATASSAPVVVDPRVVASGSFAVADRCTGAITFTNTSTGGTSYTWDFGDGQSSSGSSTAAQQHTYENRTALQKSYAATLTAENAKGCKAAKTFSVDVVPRVESAFTYDVLEKCTPMKVNLVNSSLNGTEFQWDYGHSIGKVPQQEVRTSAAPFEKLFDSEDPSSIQTYTLTLKTVDKATGCSATSSRDLAVYPRVLPSFSSTVVDRCKGAVSFQNATTGASSYTWLFGDPSSAYTTDKLDPVSHTYLNRNATSTTFNAKLVASNAIGCSAETVKDISIVPRVESSFTLEELEICTPVKVKLTNTSLNGQQFTWDYGHTIGKEPQVEVKADRQAFEKIIDSESANAVQTYPIKLTVLDKNTLCADESTINLAVHPRLAPSFTSDKVGGCSDLPVVLTNTSTGGNLSFSWDFNDGQSVKTADVTETVAHTFVNRSSTTKSYNVVLTATNAKGCKAAAAKPIGVYPKVEAAFTFVQPSKCTPFPIDITNSSLNGTEYSWDFGHTANGSKRDTLTTSKAGFRTYIYNGNSTNAQTYTLTLTARDAVTGCGDKATKTIDAQPEVKSSFGLSVDRGCTPLTVSFANTSTGSTGSSWSFGDGTSSASATPASMVFSNSDTVSIKTYNITLTSKNQDGCANISTKRVDVYPKVLADFSLDKVNGCTPLAVKVVNAYPSSAYRYEWSLGSNGASTSQQIPDLNFINSATDYTIQNEKLKLKVFYKGDATCYKEVERSVDVYPRTRSDFAMDVAEACNPLVVNFTNETKSYNSTASYRWSFGGLGSSGEANPKYTFTNLSRMESVTYPVTLTSTSAHGCTDATTKTVVVRPIPKAQMAISTASGCAPFNVEVQNLSVGAMPTYTFWLDNDRSASEVRNGLSPVSFKLDNLASATKMTEVWLEAKSDFGCVDITSQKVYTFPHVTSSFTFSPSDAGCNPLTVAFTNTSTNAAKYTWDFDDGITAFVTSPSHVFQNTQEQDKVFNVKLTAESLEGCRHTSSKDFTVFSAPIAYFTIDPPLRTYPDASFLFNNQTTPKAASWSYEWTFGDGGKYIGMNPPVYTYKTWGDPNDGYKYNVTLKVSNGSCKNEMTQFLYLKPAIPVSTFSSSVVSSCSPLETQLAHQAKYYKSIEWDFGDGTRSSEDSPYHVYKTPGMYHVQLTVKGDGGTSYSYTTLEVYPNPVASFKLAPAEAMLPEARVQFYNTSTEGSEYAWDFGDVLGASTEKNPTYSYKKLGSYDVRLKVTSKNRCVDDTLVKAAVKVVGEGVLKFPNAFIPSATGGNGGAYEVPDYKNEVFHPTSEGVVAYKLLVYSRWGEKLFESDEIGKGWDGYYKGKLCEQGVYVYRATGRFTNGKTFDLRGDLTLLR